MSWTEDSPSVFRKDFSFCSACTSPRGLNQLPFHWKRCVVSVEIMRLGAVVDNSSPPVSRMGMCVTTPSLSDVLVPDVRIMKQTAF